MEKDTKVAGTQKPAASSQSPVDVQVSNEVTIPDVHEEKQPSIIDVKVDNKVDMELTLSTSHVQYISEGRSVVTPNPDMVKVVIAYPKDWKGSRYMKEGTHMVSKYQADLFKKQGIVKSK